MSRLIDISSYENCRIVANKEDSGIAIKDLPTVDAVEVIRCKDCKYFSMTTLGMPYACWKEGNRVWGETGEHAAHHVCRRVETPEWYCADGERIADEPSE